MKLQIIGYGSDREVTLKLTAGPSERINTNVGHDVNLSNPREIQGLQLYDAPEGPGGPWKLIGAVYVQTRSNPAAAPDKNEISESPDSAALFYKLKKMALKQAGCSEETVVTRDTHLFHDLGFDSLDITEFVMDLEKEFKIRIIDPQADEISTLGNAIDLVEELTSKKRTKRQVVQV